MRIHNKNRSVIADINMIPLIDVSLILLIIFMVITPFLVQSQIQVNLPKASSAATGGDDVITIEITADGALTVGGKPVRFSKLERELSLRLAKAYKKTVLIQADKTVSIEKVVAALDIAKKLGAGKVGIGVSLDKK